MVPCEVGTSLGQLAGCSCDWQMELERVRIKDRMSGLKPLELILVMIKLKSESCNGIPDCLESAGPYEPADWIIESVVRILCDIQVDSCIETGRKDDGG